ncbi:protein phosphatase 2C domain-containing protein [Bradyrhizobium sp.]|uniref:PP2C family protein-serine/threonine phosphatase n=1 Tax=Bradyrhizobium sp. TaxID=376 RepID=UPI0025BB6E6D|nr:protein phosphatase 2C domain-containing protein [Bradyrhizobium sp.]
MPDGLATDVHGAAIQGRRQEQQDSFRSVWLAAEKAWLLVVADGMGGHAAGGTASRLAADAFVASFIAHRAAGNALAASFQFALDEANARIARGQADDPDTDGMGTTLVAAHLSPEGLSWISVGDSPLWLVSAGSIERVNEDHSFRPAVAKGAKAIANMLQSVLNGQPVAMVDLKSRPRRLRNGEFIILASDGILTLEESDIARFAGGTAATGAAAAARALLTEVENRQKSNQDNCAVVVAVPPTFSASTAAGLITFRTAGIAALILLVVIAGVSAWRLS